MFCSSLLFVTLAQAPSNQTIPAETESYFPAGVFGANGGYSEQWYSNQLRALQEPPLPLLKGAEPIYRFTWLRSFHPPIVVRIQIHNGGTGTLISKTIQTLDAVSPGSLLLDSTRTVRVKDVKRLLDLIDATRFWGMPSVSSDDSVHLDGAQWIFEAVRDGQYHVVDRWSPKRGPLRELGLYLARTLAAFKIPGNALY